MKAGIKILAFLLVGFLFVSYLFFWRVKRVVNGYLYDWSHTNPPIESIKGVDQILAEYDQISYNDLNENFLKKTQSHQPEFRTMLRKSTYYKIPTKDIYRRIVGPFRIYNFVSRDAFFRKSPFSSKTDILWLIDKRILYKAIQLRQTLKAQGYNPNGFQVVNGHRNPKHNARVGGASRSRHIKGEALDLAIGDINNDGRYTKEDKKIVLQLLEEKVIKNEGGIGLYPGTNRVHMDVRGFRARWNSY